MSISKTNDKNYLSNQPKPIHQKWKKAPGFNQVLDGDSVLKKMHSGSSVKKIQQLLNQANQLSGKICEDKKSSYHRLKEDYRFGAQTEKILIQFQKDHGLEPSGIVDKNTIEALESSCQIKPLKSKPAELPQTNITREMLKIEQLPKLTNPNKSSFVLGNGQVSRSFAQNKTEREEQALAILQDNNIELEDGKIYAVQIDKNYPIRENYKNKKEYSQARINYVRSYTGKTLIFKAQNGKLTELEGQGDGFLSASHPGQFTTKAEGTPDIDGDKISDIAHLPTGIYEYQTPNKYVDRINPVDNFEVYRDQNHDGLITGKEKHKRFSGSGMQIHAGYDNRPKSIGCQTMPPSDYNKFKSLIMAEAPDQSTFTYILARYPEA